MGKSTMKGFTLLELLIVLSVIGVLISIALPRFKGMQEEGNVAKVKGELRTLQTAVESFYIHNTQQYPADQPAFEGLKDQKPKIVGSVLKDPFKADTYQYKKTGGFYIIFSKTGIDNTTCNPAISDAGVVTGDSDQCMYVSNGDVDTKP